MAEFQHPLAGIMDRNGMLPPHSCKGCGKPLNADGFHPAELYAGTYTGLCYGCEKSAPYVQLTFRDGAQQWSFPPHCPSWRRERETFIGYPDCANERCGGRGRILVSRGSQGGPYPEHCQECFKRFHSDPLRVEWTERGKEAYTAAQAGLGRRHGR